MFIPHARFQIPTNLEAVSYWEYLENLLEDFVCNAHPDNNVYLALEVAEFDMEGGIMNLTIEGRYFYGCKLHLCNTDQGLRDWHGILFRDHADGGEQITGEIFRLARAFARFLKEKNVSFQCYAMTSDPREEILQDQFDKEADNVKHS